MVASRPLPLRVYRMLVGNSALLLVGAVIALALHFAANDVGMVFFFALAAKEVFESTLPGGALGSGRSAALPVLAASGGIQAKMGALLSFAAGLAAAGLAVVLRVGRFARAGNR